MLTKIKANSLYQINSGVIGAGFAVFVSVSVIAGLIIIAIICGNFWHWAM